ncbi:MAG: hypothetical protein A2469_04605 [Candidatus Magasanikbacteria bacterium RIFOXYC2_FULL_40_16]|uniref:Uncharacterized protein n=1 Tax=Candidatus Magasanikbacteria bacterium RIFOXYC2_FULL_40_16 TaxID=1798703 RepID=A0A1F6P038_9BACT|nr:MAG: hypothetical protein A2469_04605 [Candidatus Magasanikbacteria bacterium RIFOXYC2_FULL_40_16]
MSVNLYLSEKVRELPGFESKPYSDGSGDEMRIKGMRLQGDKGRFYLYWDMSDSLSDELKDLVEEISCYETIPQMGYRESGIYRHGSAECELIPEDQGNSKRQKLVYRLKITASKLEDVREILHKVKTGAIRPEESYECRQSGKDRSELERELSHTKEMRDSALQVVKDLMNELESVNHDFSRFTDDYVELQKKITRMYNFAGDLLGRQDGKKKAFRWPFVSRLGVVDKMLRALDGKE